MILLNPIAVVVDGRISVTIDKVINDRNVSNVIRSIYETYGSEVFNIADNLAEAYRRGTLKEYAEHIYRTKKFVPLIFVMKDSNRALIILDALCDLKIPTVLGPVRTSINKIDATKVSPNEIVADVLIKTSRTNFYIIFVYPPPAAQYRITKNGIKEYVNIVAHENSEVAILNIPCE